jgi:amino acid transporter
VFGFLAFAGFEGAPALGEESLQPKKMIPRALKIAVLVVGVFFLLTTISQTLGYGNSTESVAEFVNNSSPYGDLGSLYVGDWLGTLLDLVASLSLFAITLGTVNGAARELYALTRDATGETRLTKLYKRGAPTIPLAVISVAVPCFLTGQRLAGTCGSGRNLLLADNWNDRVAGGLRIGHHRRIQVPVRRRAQAPSWQAIIPVLALAFVIYTIYKNVVGVASPYNVFPYVVAGWRVVGIVLVLTVPGLAGRVRERLASSADADV